MGRYYNGDIEGKFWFALQPSNCGEQYKATQGNFVRYEVDRDNYDFIKQKLREQKASISFDKIETFFEENNGYNDQMLEEAGIAKDELSIFADIGFGKKIIKFFDENPNRQYLNYAAEF